MATLVTEDTHEKAITILKALAHHDRLQMVNILMNGECNVKKLAKLLVTKQSHTSIQLSILRFAGVLESRKDGNKVYYSFANNGIKLRKLSINMICCGFFIVRFL